MDVVGFILTASAVGFAGFLTAACATFYGVRRLIYAAKGEPYVPLLQSSRKRNVKYLDAGAGVKPEEVTRILRRYLNADMMGSYAKAGLSALEQEKVKSEAFESTLDSKFAPGSISWEKFASAGSGVHEAVLHNCITLANRIQSFDVNEYRNVERAFKRTPWGRGMQPTAAQSERRELYRKQIGEMNALLVANENLLLELGRLTAELNKLDSIDAAETNSRLVEEIRTLIDETKYYSQ